MTESTQTSPNSTKGSPSSSGSESVGVAKSNGVPSKAHRSGSFSSDPTTSVASNPARLNAAGPPSTHLHNMHFYHPSHPYHGGPPPTYDPGLGPDPTAARGLPPGPYTKAQYEYESLKPASSLVPPYTSATAGPATQSPNLAAVAVPGSNSSPPTAAPLPATTATAPTAASKTSPPSMPPNTNTAAGRDPPPPHTYHHGEHATLPPPPHHPHAPATQAHLIGRTLPTARHPHRPHNFATYREDMGRGPPRTTWHTHEYGVRPPHPYYDAANPSTYPPGTPPRLKASALAAGATLGPYRYSDTTLRREALINLKAAQAKAQAYAEEKDTHTSNLKDAATNIGQVRREGATSPSQIESSHREEVTTMGCTCKKTKCLKLYCQCFAVKIYCGGVCRCMTCHNIADFEKERQDAIRNILLRNPQAFDTKFKKSLPNKAAPELAHKLGCKCRKSACMKKYCECYAGGVKCNANCRCVGCKNMPSGGPSPGMPPHALLAPAPQGAMNSLLANVAMPGVQKQRETHMMNAAQNLAFLKHASPKPDKSSHVPRRTNSQESVVPSLASEDSPKDAKANVVSMPRKASSIPEPNTAEKTAVNALLMAAVAMTEMSGQTPTKKASTPPRETTEETNGDFETPQKNLLRQFQSPKRKQSATEENMAPRQQDGTSSTESSPSKRSVNESPKRDNSGMIDFTPSVQHKIKRTRLGSVQKGAPRDVQDGDDDNDNQNNDMVIGSPVASSQMVMETPTQTKKTASNDLTPVSARCIDFKRMHVHEGNTPLKNKQTDSPSSKEALPATKPMAA